MERRRLAAARELADGAQQRKVARKYRVSEATVSRWASSVRQTGVESLRRTTAYRPPRLADDQLGRLLEILVAGAEASGFDTDLWTTDRVALVIKNEFGIEFHPDHVRKILKNKLGFSYQKPKREAKERDEKARATWLRTTWPRLKKTR